MRDPRAVEKPERCEKLEVDHRGYPIFFTAIPPPGHELNFQAINPRHRAQCAAKKLCGICGEKLEYWIAFIGGPIAAKNRAFSDAPMHYDCARYAMRVCPFLSLPKRQYRKHIDEERYEAIPGVLKKKPEKMCLYVTRGFRLESTGTGLGGWVFRAAKAKRIEWYIPGQEEVVEVTM